MKYFSMFSGIGGFELGIQNAYRSAERGVQTDTETDQGQGLFTQERQSISSPDGWTGERTTDWTNPGPLCIGYSEIDKYAIKVYERQFNGHKNYGNATTIDPVRLPDFDLLVGGFPCQAFSIAGKRAGFNDTRGTLFFDVARILKDKRPRHLVLENVKGLLSHDEGKTFSTILGVLADLGYRVEWQILNSKHHGVPQNRERVYIIGHLRGECGREVLPIGHSSRTINQGYDKRHTESEVASTIRSRYGNGSGSHIAQLNNPAHSNDRVYGTDGVSPTLNTMQGGNRQPFITNPKMNNYKPNYKESVAITATSYKEPPLVNAIRRLTPIECERLQGFPDNWTSLGIGEEPISDTQRYKMCGNAVTVNVVEAVVSNMIDCLTPAEVYA